MHQNNEISIYDLWLMFVKRKKLFLLVFITVFILGSVFAIFQPKKYEYSQIIQISTHLNINDAVVPLIASQTAILRINNIFFPTILNSYAQQSAALPTMHITVKDLNAPGHDGGVISLTARGAAMDEKAFKTLFTDIFGQLQKYTNEQLQREKAALTVYLGDLQKQLALQQTAQKNVIQSTIGKRNVDFEIGQAIMVANQASATVKLMHEVSSVKSKLANMQRTHFISDCIRSRHPVGLSKSVVMILSAVVGAILGLFLVFIAEFIACIRTLKQSKDD